MKCLVKVAKFIEFDERLHFAKKLIDQCLSRWSQGAHHNLKAVVYDAFKVDDKGKLDTKRILGLRKLAISDEDWKKAMELISNSVTICGRKAYMSFRARDEKTKQWMPIKLDFAVF